MYFDFCKTNEDVKKKYYELVKKLHPDNGGDLKEFQKMQSEFIGVFEKVKKIHINKDGKTYEKNNEEEGAQQFINLINELLKLNQVIVELIGEWVWISGNTKDHKEILKKLGCRYSGLKKCWYFHSGKYHRGSNNEETLESLRFKYKFKVFNKNLINCEVSI